MIHAPRYIFFGTPDFAVTILNELVKANALPQTIITAPDKPRGRGNVIQPTAVKTFAIEKNIPVLTPKNPNDASFVNTLAEKNPELFVVAAYGKLLKKELLAVPQYGVLNVHPSLLPKYRGASPVQGALLAGETETGATIMLVDEEMDHGPIVAQEKIQIGKDDNSITLSETLAHLSGILLARTIPQWVKGAITPKEQNHSEATFTRTLQKKDGRINWNSPAEQIVRLVRAYQLWPTAWTILKTDAKELRVKILKAEAVNEAVDKTAPGTIVKKSSGLLVATQDRWILVHQLQLEGKNPITAAEFHYAAARLN